MREAIYTILFLIIFSSFTFGQNSVGLMGGNIFDGKKFVKKDIYSVNGKITFKKPKNLEKTFNIKNQFVIPPFGDAHCHGFDATYNIKQSVNSFLRDGVFYAKVQTNSLSGAKKVKNSVNIPTSLDISYAHGSLTNTNGHVFEIYETLALGLIPTPEVFAKEREKISKSRLVENDAYYIIDNFQDLESKWQKVLDGKPDFIKIHLVTSEKFDEKSRNLDKIKLGDIGVNPELVPVIVKKAHKANLKVSAHIETVTDYRIAIRSGVDEIAHLVGYYIADNEKDEIKMLTEKDAKETAKKGVWVILAPLANNYDNSNKERTTRLIKHNLRLLKKYKVNIALGSDRYRQTALDDVLQLHKFKVFNNLEMLKLWSEKTPQNIFPNRKIGKLKKGYEASFLTLNNNPLKNFEAVKNINMRFKQGFPIEIEKSREKH